MGRRDFGSVRKLPSGKYQARIRDQHGQLVSLGTFRGKAEAVAVLAENRTDQARGNWVDPKAGKVTLATYADAWVDEHPGLRPRTRTLYRASLRLHVHPTLGGVELAKLTPSAIRRWHSQLRRDSGLAPSTVAKLYRTVHAVMETAVRDELVVKNPCNVPGAAVDQSDERPVATVAQVRDIADAIGPRFRAAVWIGAGCGLRLSEILALRRMDVDLLRSTIRVERQVVEHAGTVGYGPPKTDAGKRTVSVPQVVAEALEKHLAEHGDPDPGGLLFAASRHDGVPVSRSVFRRGAWLPACRRAGVEGLRFHDLRHTCATIAAASGASTKELMARLGHASPQAALRYQHATRERDEVIAAAIHAAFDVVPVAEATVSSIGG